MATVITKTIGMLANGTVGPGRDYKNLTEFEAALPASLVAVDQQWTAQLYNDGLIQETIGTIQFGATTDATRFVRLEAAPGQSFMDHDFSADPLRLDQTYGVLVKLTSGVNLSSIIEPLAACDFMQIHGLQLWTTDSKGRAARLKSSANNSIEDCILLADNAVAREVCDFVNASPARNCLIIAGSADALSNGARGRGSSSFINCTIVRPSDLAQGNLGVDLGTSNAQFENCAIFGFSKAVDLASTGDFNATDDSVVANLAGTNTKRSLVFTSQFVNTLLASQDWKVKDSAADIADGGASTNGFVTGFDILGRARDATLANRSIGAYELTAGGGQVIKTATVATAFKAGLQVPRIASLAWTTELLVLEQGAITWLAEMQAGSPAALSVLAKIGAVAAVSVGLEGGMTATGAIDAAFTGVLIAGAGNTLPVEALAQAARPFTIPVAALGGFLAAAAMPLDISATIISAAPLPLEFTAGAVIDRQLATSWLAAMAAPHVLPAAWSTIVVIERDVPADWAGSQIFIAGNVRVFSRDARGRVFTSSARAVVFPTAGRGRRFDPAN